MAQRTTGVGAFIFSEITHYYQTNVPWLPPRSDERFGSCLCSMLLFADVGGNSAKAKEKTESE